MGLSMILGALLLQQAAPAPPPLPTGPALAAAPAPQQQVGASPGATPAAQPAKRPPGYLTRAETPDTFHVLPPAPQPGSPARAEDVAAFRETRKLQGSPRWALARSDAAEAGIVADMTCAMSVSLTQENAPHLFTLLNRMGRDAGAITTIAKEQFRQQRPFVALGDKDAICTEDSRKDLARSFAYPSGHTTWSWAVGLVLAEAAPDLAVPILARARAFGESRVVCGVHWVSDVNEGRTNASVLVAVLHAHPDFVADLAEAKLEIAAARKAAQAAPPTGDAARCAVEKDASEHTPWVR